MLELYYFPTATCGLKARLAAEEKGVGYVSRVLDRDAGELNTPAYRALNPQGVVPTLVHDGRVVVESSVIMRYLDDAFSGPDLRPETAGDRADANLWMKRADEGYLPALGALTYAIFVRHKVLEKSPEDLQAYYDAIPDPARRAHRISVVERGLDAPEVVPAAKRLAGMVAAIETAVQRSKWLAGPRWSLADAAIIPFVERLHQLGGLWLAERPALDKWWARVTARASYRATAEAQRDRPREAAMRERGRAALPKLSGIA